MDWNLFWTIVGTGIAVVSLIYGFLRNFKLDMNEKFHKIDQRFEKIDQRFDKVDQRFEKIDQRFEKLEDDMQKFKMDMIEVKTILRMKECCMIKDDLKLPKGE